MNDIRRSLDWNFGYRTEDDGIRYYTKYRIKIFTAIRYPASESLIFRSVSVFMPLSMIIFMFMQHENENEYKGGHGHGHFGMSSFMSMQHEHEHDIKGS